MPNPLLEFGAEQQAKKSVEIFGQGFLLKILTQSVKRISRIYSEGSLN